MMMKNRMSTPHDGTFRQFLTHPDFARDFMELQPPAKLRAICDLSTLKLESIRSLRTTSGKISVTHSTA